MFRAIFIGGSAGSFQLINKLTSEINPHFSIPIIITLHRLRHIREGYLESLAAHANLPIIEPFDKEKIKGGNIYIAPSNYHLLIELDDRFSLSTEPLVHHSRPSIDLTFMSAAFSYRNNALGIILSGANKDGTEGLAAIKQYGGTTIVQNPEEAQVNTMPQSAINNCKVDMVLTLKEIILFLNSL